MAGSDERDDTEFLLCVIAAGLLLLLLVGEGGACAAPLAQLPHELPPALLEEEEEEAAVDPMLQAPFTGASGLLPKATYLALSPKHCVLSALKTFTPPTKKPSERSCLLVLLPFPPLWKQLLLLCSICSGSPTIARRRRIPWFLASRSSVAVSAA